MNKRLIDKTKKSNIKCEHCLFYDKPNKPNQKPYCCCYSKEVNYWNRCKGFTWNKYLHYR